MCHLVLNVLDNDSLKVPDSLNVKFLDFSFDLGGNVGELLFQFDYFGVPLKTDYVKESFL